jgi:hypothetical protein
MTIEELENFRSISAEVDAIQKEIETLYTPISCPNGKSSTGFSNTPSDPTERAVDKILEKREELIERQTYMIKTLQQIEDWLDTVKDPDIRSIVRWHYLLKATWKQTAKKLNNYDDSDACRKKIKRYFEKKV